MKYNLKLKKGKNKVYIVLIMLFVLVLFLYFFIENNIKPKLIAISEIKARLFATQAINDAVSKKIELNSFNDLIFIK
ncbi:MAG: sporulation protein YunB, partial [Clostridiales bacterium]|nr:sporulation protein YunB [Clostridiales bacterium]